MSSGLFEIHESCPVCGVRFERKPGESTGASIMALSLLPIPAIAISFIMLLINPDLSLWVVIGVPAALILILSVVSYRHTRGVWIAIIALTDGLHTDDERPQIQ